MQIEPMQPVHVLLKCGQEELHCSLVHFSETDIVVVSTDFIDKNSMVEFKSNFFTGEGVITHIQYSHYKFTYSLSIGSIKYRPGMIVNTIL